MQISNSLTVSSLTLSLEQQRESTARMTHIVPASQDRAPKLRSVEYVKQAELLMQRQRSRSTFTQISDASSRSHRALSSYQSVQSGQERDYISEVLGIDVYA